MEKTRSNGKGKKYDDMGENVMSKNRLLKLDKNYTPLPAKEGDEIFPNGIFTFNISRILEHIANEKLSVERKQINVGEWFKTHFMGSVNEEHLLSVDITKPVIQGEIRPNRFGIIDGHHRITKAYRDGVELIDSFLLKGEQLIPFFTTMRAYQAFIEYWNSKCYEDNYL